MRLLCLSLCAFFLSACPPAVGDPCSERGEQSGCPPTSICEAVDAPSNVCEVCTLEVDGSRICRLRCLQDDDCDDDEECVEFTRFEPDVSYLFCRPLPEFEPEFEPEVE